ncbi:SDR family oxidoreductase [Oceanobacillus bengalensis]|uniref:NAD-dependent epimerase/dehydratase family protein n=1 Tax=Oceanobacillus bengalensis TaxID=1435466 RepID=A0A494Z9K7_9BACI|nr:SDR family oxidoreductase [Oceanobacillus bengalensis]RKQ18729.1 NAD-dependent epimerase/dehydratase family protein [Oceanobacillus bengalensis]
MSQTYLITGFPGFLARNLIKQLIHDHSNKIEHIYLLVLPTQEHQASKEIEMLSTSAGVEIDSFTIISGDITLPELEMTKEWSQKLQNTVTHVFHLAAIYDLAVPEEIAYSVNVQGTNYVNNWVKNVKNLKRYIYFSTAYVSGTREGKIYETDLKKRQTFRNHYERTKYEAEILVEALKDDVPTTIIRPGIVKGHSKTGETIKFDGLYFVLNMLDQLRFLPVIPYLGKNSAEGNFVPSDYVLRATSYLAIAEIGEGKTYHLTDPNPYTMNEIYQMLTEAYLGMTPKGALPLALAKSALNIGVIRKWLQVEREAMDYFSIHSSYDASIAVNDLAGTGITCPDLKDTIEPMICFYKKYKDDSNKHIQIL